ncbi:MAG: Kelch repeat-containing protein [Frankiales bacterium]|nr:Kelch repeat-containing protein [Frankiales bacterium]
MRRALRPAMIGVLGVVAAACTASPQPSGGSVAPSRTTPAATATASAGASPAPGGATGTPTATASAALTAPVARVVGHLPVPLSRMGVAMLGGRVLSLGGLLNSGSSNAVYSFDPSSLRTTRTGTLAAAVHDTAAVVLAGRVLVVGGGAATESSAVQRVAGDGTTSLAGRLPEPRSDLNAVTVGTSMYVVGGYTGAADVATVLRSSDGRRFTVVGRLPVTVRYAAVVALGTDIWVIGGDHLRAPTDAVQRIDTLTGRVTLAGHLARALGHASAWTSAGEILVAGGTLAGGSHTDAIARLDLRSFRLTQVAALPSRTSDMGVAQVGDVTYLLGGESAHRIDTVVAVRR